MQNYTLEQKTQKTFECRYFPKQRLRCRVLYIPSKGGKWIPGSQIRRVRFGPHDLGPQDLGPGQ